MSSKRELERECVLSAGFFVPDIIMAAITGCAVSQTVGPLVPFIGQWLSSRHIIQFFLCLSVISSVLSTQMFPYSSLAPKRVLLQHTIETKGIVYHFPSMHCMNILYS